MTRASCLGAIHILCVCAAVMAAASAWAETLPASEASGRLVDVAVSPGRALGRVFFNESGWHSPADQHLIIRVLGRRAELSSNRVRSMAYGERLVWIAKRYSTRTFLPDEVRSIPKAAERSARQSWVNHLAPECPEPEGWPLFKSNGEPHPPWRNYEDACKRLFQRARAFVRQQASGSCVASMPVDHWGGPMDDERAERFGWKRADWKCTEGGTTYEAKNRAWCDPGLSRCEPGGNQLWDGTTP